MPSTRDEMPPHLPHAPALLVPSWLLAYFHDDPERSRYLLTLRKLSMRPVSAWRLAQRANLMHQTQDVRHALRANLRYERVHAHGPERFRLRKEHRHATTPREDRGRAPEDEEGRRSFPLGAGGFHA